MRERFVTDGLYAVLTHQTPANNLNTHSTACRYESFAPNWARQIAARMEWHDTPKHGSWLDIAEDEFAAMTTQCLGRRIGSLKQLGSRS